MYCYIKQNKIKTFRNTEMVILQKIKLNLRKHLNEKQACMLYASSG